jgi:hypothetical protein
MGRMHGRYVCTLGCVADDVCLLLMLFKCCFSLAKLPCRARKRARRVTATRTSPISREKASLLHSCTAGTKLLAFLLRRAGFICVYLSINFFRLSPSLFVYINARQAYHLGMFGSDYAWILQGSPKDVPWWSDSANTVCSPAALMAAVEGLLLVSSHNSLAGPEPSLSGLVS